ncbi:MFS transporter [Pediococcus pentosaceus]|uniref:MFS transporter n=1 Tax=Pediococcus pentosaceus TaxID=1255 RepID=UPI000CFFBC53|nr:MFS transporter [Pediococcus pentosaceus]AVL01839.1 hypothetical protein PP40703_03040 [Pediococcus pentosaceus]MBF7134992.1 MFS transporter [Pediococcus pentosaceus]QPT35964.1 MFS transporter [Pediococcus pentosaceus]
MKKVISKKYIKPLLVGLFFSNIATNSVQFIISLYILDQTGSTSLFANIMAIALISKIIYTPLSGNLIDRYSKKILMVVLDSMYLICTLILILAVHHSAICSVLIYNIIIGAISSAETPLVQASVPLLVEKQDLMVEWISESDDGFKWNFGANGSGSSISSIFIYYYITFK